MARVTIEDCVVKVKDRFELVAVAAQRAKDIASGAPLTIERKGEKDTVIALREIAESTVDVETLREGLVKSYQRKREMEESHEAPSEGAALIAEELAGEEQVALDEAVASADATADDITEEADLASDDDDSDEETVQKMAEEALEGMSFEEDNLDVDD